MTHWTPWVRQTVVLRVHSASFNACSTHASPSSNFGIALKGTRRGNKRGDEEEEEEQEEEEQEEEQEEEREEELLAVLVPLVARDAIERRV